MSVPAASPPRVGCVGVGGLAVAADPPPDGPPVPGPPDVVVDTGPAGPVPAGPPPGRVLAALAVPGVAPVWVTAADGGYRYRLAGLADARITADTGRVELTPAPGAEALVPVLVGGGITAVILGLRGRPPLHGSAVDLGGGAVAVLGSSGAGKSTVAAALCGAGGRLVTDDVLAYDPADGEILAHPGVRGVRLRDPALARRYRWGRSPSPDGRTVVRPPAVDGPVPLAAVVVLDRSPGRPPGLVRLRGAAAAGAVALHPRTAGWVDARVQRTHLGRVAALARAVPVFGLGLDGPPGPAGGPRLRRALADAGVPVGDSPPGGPV